MTKDEYVHYSDCRQASFTYRKGDYCALIRRLKYRLTLLLPARRFREFINFSAYLDVRPNDDIVDILGFLSFEMVRSLCVTALEVREQLERSAPTYPPRNPQKRSTTSHNPTNHTTTIASPTKRKSISISTPHDGNSSSPNKKLKSDVLSPETFTQTPLPTNHSPPKRNTHHNPPPVPLFAPPPSARQPLSPHFVLEAFAQIQREQASNRVGGMRNFRGGMGRARVALV